VSALSDLQVSLAFRDGVVLAFSGELDTSVVAIVTNVLETIVADAALPRNLVIDLREVEAIDADANTALEKARRYARRRGFRVDVRPSHEQGGNRHAEQVSQREE
jgi:anti-anti-sigma regulatory factor